MLPMRTGKQRVGLRTQLSLNPLKLWLCLGLGNWWPRLGKRLSGLWSGLSLKLVL